MLYTLAGRGGGCLCVSVCFGGWFDVGGWVVDKDN